MNSEGVLPGNVSEKFKTQAKSNIERFHPTTPIRKDIRKIDDLTAEMGKYRGRLAAILESSPEMKALLMDPVNGHAVRKAVAKSILSEITDFPGKLRFDLKKMQPTTMGLYERADWDAFLSTLEEGVQKHIYKYQDYGENDTPEYYKNLGAAINCSNYLNNQVRYNPKQQGFQRAKETFGQEYQKNTLFSSDKVNSALKIYEDVLSQIKAANDGFVPKALVENTPERSGSFWDNNSRRLFTEHLKKDSVRFDDFDIMTYLTLGKAKGLFLNRFDLNIVSKK